MSPVQAGWQVPSGMKMWMPKLLPVGVPFCARAHGYEENHHQSARTEVVDGILNVLDTSHCRTFQA